jgi:two-component system chemotaxis response regulator CheB
VRSVELAQAWRQRARGELAQLVAAHAAHVLHPHQVLVAPVGRHLVFKRQKLCWYDGPRVLNQKPSIDVLFNSAAENFGKRLLGLLLTGMGSDGAEGCLHIKKQGGFTIVQDPASCAVYGMPRAAIELQAATRVLPLAKIAPFILKLLGLNEGRLAAGASG